MKLKQKNLFILLSISTGFLSAFSFPKINLFFLMWAALIPLFHIIFNSSVRQSFFYTFLSSLVANMLCVFFVLDSVRLLSGNYFIAFFFYGALCLYFSLYWGIWGALSSFIKRYCYKPWLFVLVSACLWVVLEYIKTYALTGWPWTLLGYSQYLFTYIIQIAEFTGVYGVSFVIMLINGFLYFAVFKRKKTYLLAAAALFVFVVIFGIFRYNSFRNFGDKEYTVAAVQSNIEQYKKLDNSYKTETTLKLEEAAEKLSEIGADLNVWSESEIINLIPADIESYIFADKIAKTAGGFNIIGAPYLDGTGRLFGAVFYFDGNGGYVSMHTKNHLIPFGEYLPLGLSKYITIGADNIDLNKVKGYDTVVFTDGDIYAGSLICTENFFPELSRRFVLAGAKVLTSNSNDAWFLDSSGPYKHFMANVIRAVESRKAIIVAANTGVSAIIDASGKIAVSTGVYERAIITGTFYQNDYLTFYMLYGDVFSVICIFFIFFFVIIVFLRRHILKNSNETNL
ncbi:MAG: apolipoprotein N-acyltransferase [Endomicrobium sp.]|jgi:apolipoprotein N-acyltransferase|nr:apolipoprotein N-acyltransferase [Endomicrobium sp.]